MPKKLSAKPILKWVGGKTQLLTEIQKRYPPKITKYCEPFVGGGAILFDILSKYSPSEVMINDINKSLICVYEQVRDNPDTVIDILQTYDKKYNAEGVTEDDRFMIYMNNRTNFNANRKAGIFNSETAALFIFLNKTCFNGLYRVNSHDAFNVPKGNIKNPIICDEKNLRNASILLQNVTITYGSYENCESFIDDNTFVYLDPPYREIRKNVSFKNYDSSGFTDADQIELSEFVKRIHAKQAKFILSNSDPKNADVNDDFFDNMYSEFIIDRVPAARKLNRNAACRGPVNELMIYNSKKKTTTKPESIVPCEVISFIEKFKFEYKDELETVFTLGNCYYFAVILKDRFDADVYYLPITNHFIAKIANAFFDITGIVLPDEQPVKWSDYEQLDPACAEAIKRDCMRFETR